MSLLFHALWLLCGIGAAVFAATAVRGRWSLGLLAAGFLAGAIVSFPAPPASEWLGVLAALVAVTGLVWPRHWILTSLTAGLLAGVWSALLQAQSLPPVAAVVFAAGVPAASAWCAARRPEFAPPVLRDEALLVTAIVALAVAVAPGVADGWRAAVQLNVRIDGPQADVPVWALVVGLTAMGSGALFSAWSRR